MEISIVTIFLLCFCANFLGLPSVQAGVQGGSPHAPREGQFVTRSMTTTLQVGAAMRVITPDPLPKQ
jgi:hypothetical protein